MLDLRNILISQQRLRDYDQIMPMIRFVADGGRWTAEALRAKAGPNARPIQMTRFPDGVWMIHDGHHRVVASYLAGHYRLDDDEFEWQNWRYEDYEQAAPEKGFVTPFAVWQEVRVPDFEPFKQTVLDLFATGQTREAARYIDEHRASYCEQRTAADVPTLAEHYLTTFDGDRRPLDLPPTLWNRLTPQQRRFGRIGRLYQRLGDPSSHLLCLLLACSWPRCDWKGTPEDLLLMGPKQRQALAQRLIRKNLVATVRRSGEAEVTGSSIPG